MTCINWSNPIVDQKVYSHLYFCLFFVFLSTVFKYAYPLILLVIKSVMKWLMKIEKYNPKIV